jgi:hypothetical protein
VGHTYKEINEVEEDNTGCDVVGHTLSRNSVGGDFTLGKHVIKKLKDKLKKLGIGEQKDIDDLSGDDGDENDKGVEKTGLEKIGKKQISLEFSKNFKPDVKKYRKENKRKPYADRDYLEDLSDIGDDDEKEMLKENVCLNSYICTIFIFFFIYLFFFLICRFLRMI